MLRVVFYGGLYMQCTTTFFSAQFYFSVDKYIFSGHTCIFQCTNMFSRHKCIFSRCTNLFLRVQILFSVHTHTKKTNTPGARFSKVPVTFRARSYILKLKSIEWWRSLYPANQLDLVRQLRLLLLSFINQQNLNL